MVDTNLGIVEARFADLIWENEPIHSRELAKICAIELNWKRPTAYNVLRKLCEKGIFQNIIPHQPTGFLWHAGRAICGRSF